MTFALSFKSDRHFPRAFGHLYYISQLTSDIRHIAGVENIPADVLTRLTVSSIISHAVIDLNVIVRDQLTLKTLALSSDKCSSCKSAYLPLLSSERTILCDNSTGTPRPFVSDSHRGSIFLIAASVKLVTDRFSG